jgi:hypothetical protein
VARSRADDVSTPASCPTADTDPYTHPYESPDAPAGLIINEEQATVVRQIFEMFASGYGLVNISRYLEEQRIPIRLGRSQWHRYQIRAYATTTE